MAKDRLTIDDIRRGGHCVRGTRLWFESRGLNFRKFLKEGCTIEEARALGDGHVNTVLDRKAEREG